MSYLNCPGCGQKALTVATRCPRCGMPFETRYVDHPASGARRRRVPLALLVAIGVVTLLIANAARRRFSGSSAARPPAVALATQPPAAQAPPALATPAELPVATADSASLPETSVSLAATESLPVAVDSEPASAPPAAVQLAESTETERRFARTWVNVRADRSGSAPVTRVLRPGEMVVVDLPRQGWYRIVADQQALGYVDGRYLDTSPASASP